MRRYLFFNSSCEHFGYKCKSLAELRIDESEADGALAKMLEVLKHIHYTFFKDHVDRDVRQVVSYLVDIVDIGLSSTSCILLTEI